MALFSIFYLLHWTKMMRNRESNWRVILTADVKDFVAKEQAQWLFVFLLCIYAIIYSRVLIIQLFTRNLLKIVFL